MEMTEAVNAEFFEQLGKGKVVPLVPRGISMLPFIQGGRDMVLIHKEEKVGIGDIVLVPHDGRLILHRVYAIDGTRFVRKTMLKLRRKWYKMRGLNPE